MYRIGKIFGSGLYEMTFTFCLLSNRAAVTALSGNTHVVFAVV
jgi:hypothetical protein